jgi:3-methylfumaryl-CoA hydratase
MSTLDYSTEKDYSAWIGREEIRVDLIDQRTAQALAATLDLNPEAMHVLAPLPPLWHWVYFTPNTLRSELGIDGHPKRGGFLPPVELPNRMWAGGRFVFHHPLRVGDSAQRISRILRAERKFGRSGELVFVTVQHTISGPLGIALVEEHDIVYRESIAKSSAQAGEVVHADAEFRRMVHPDAQLLFRYSALTFNGHRIHYDHPYVTQQEGYPGLIVHGPLIATLLVDTFREACPETEILTFSFRALGPLFDTEDFDVCGRVISPGHAELWAECGGKLAMRAELGFKRR